MSGRMGFMAASMPWRCGQSALIGVNMAFVAALLGRMMGCPDDVGEMLATPSI